MSIKALVWGLAKMQVFFSNHNCFEIAEFLVEDNFIAEIAVCFLMFDKIPKY